MYLDMLIDIFDLAVNTSGHSHVTMRIFPFAKENLSFIL